MFVDASALTAMIVSELDGPDLLERLLTSRDRQTSPMAIWETVVAVGRIAGLPVSEAHQGVLEFLELMEISIMPITSDCGDLAIVAYDRFGKSRHPAGLNFGDCFAYACARRSGVPLLYKGDDFSLTDIEAA